LRRFFLLADAPQPAPQEEKKKKVPRKKKKRMPGSAMKQSRA
jgi:hypothetical protein